MDFERYKPGMKCIVNNGGDLYMWYEARPFIGKECTIIKRTRSGLIQVSLNSNPKLTLSVGQTNITFEGQPQ